MTLIRHWKSFKMRRNKESSYQMRRVSFYLTLWQEQASWNTSRVVSYICMGAFRLCGKTGGHIQWLTSSRKMSGHRRSFTGRSHALVIHDRRSGKLKCTSALIKLRIREERTTLCPPALISLIFVTFSAPNGWNFENEWCVYDLSEGQKISVYLIKGHGSSLESWLKRKCLFLVWKLNLVLHVCKM